MRCPSSGLVARGALLGLAAGAGVALAAPGVVLRHQLTPGSVTAYQVRVDTVRRLGARVQSETRTGSLIRMIFREDRPGTATCAQMLELDTVPPSDDAISTRPAPDKPRSPEAPSPEWVQLSIARVGLKRVPLIVPGETAWSRRALSAVLDVTDWPDRDPSAGDSWERALRMGPTAGEQRYRLEAIEGVGTDVRARITIRTDMPPPEESVARRLVRAESTLIWSVRDRELVSLEGQVVTREAGGAGDWEVTRRIVLTRGRRSRIAGRQLETERDAIIQLGQAVSAYRREDYGYASRTLRTFTRRWPRSRWRPVADYLTRRIREERTSREPLTIAELEESLTKLLALWNQAERDGDLELLDRCRSSLTHLTDVNRPEIARLLDGPEASPRSLACFALAFGAAPADPALLQRACGDDDARVRRTALYALTIRASPLTSADTLLSCLADGDAIVRQRACEAIGACVSYDSPRITDVRSELAGRLADDSPPVVLAAAQALLRVGSATEIEQIRRAAEQATSPGLGDALRQVLEVNKTSAPASR